MNYQVMATEGFGSTGGSEVSVWQERPLSTHCGHRRLRAACQPLWQSGRLLSLAFCTDPPVDYLGLFTTVWTSGCGSFPLAAASVSVEQSFAREVA